MKLSGLAVLINLALAYGATLRGSSKGTNDSSDRGGLSRQTQQVTPIFSVVVNNTQDPLFNGLNIPANAAQVGMWSGVNSWPVVPIHAAVLYDGRMITYGTPTGNGVQDGRTFVFWDPKQGVGNGFITVPNAQQVDSFCGNGAMLPSGKFFAAGGASGTSGFSGFGVTIIDLATSTPVDAQFTIKPRWYSTLTSLPDGRKVISGGGVPYFGTSSTTPEIFTEGQGWQLLTGATSEDAFGSTNAHFWYPRQWVTPTGSIFGVSTEKMWEMQIGGAGSIRTIGNFKTAPNESTLPNVGPTSTAVMYDTGKIIQVGGNGLTNGAPTTSSKAATVFDINGIGSGNVIVQDTAPMNFGRQWPSSLVLPNGKVLVTGGTTFADNAGSNAVLAAEIWDPATGTWTVGPSQALYRGYHSESVLLPDGAVYVGGGGVPGPLTNFNFELYYPPYLFTMQNGASVLAKRPTIISLSNNAGTYGNQLQLQLAPGDDVAQVSFITLPSVTHSFDSDMRRMRLAFQVTSTGVQVTLPASANLAPPGYYYLSVVNAKGVPSTAVIIGLDAVAPPATRLPNPVPTTPVARPPVASPTAKPVVRATSRPTTPVAHPPVARPTVKPVRGATPRPTRHATPSPTRRSTPPPTISPTPLPTVSPTPVPVASPVAVPPNPTHVPVASPVAAPPNPTPVPVASPVAAPPNPTPLPVASPVSVPTYTQLQAKRISVGSDGTVAAVDGNGNLFVSSYGTAWTSLRNGVKDVAVVGNSEMYIVGQDANVYRLNGNNWDQIGIFSSQIATASDATVAVVNSVLGTIWVKTNYDDTPNWSMVPGVFQATRVAIVSQSSLYYLTADGSVFRSDRINPPVKVGVRSLEISACSDGTIIVANIYGELWQKVNDDNVEAWFRISGTAQNVAVQNKNSRYIIDSTGTVLRSPY